MKVSKLAAITILAIGISVSAHAQATRTWVSGVGDDVNPCSRTAPCKTFAGAQSKTAPGGEISVLDPGGYGAVTIIKSLTLDGAGTLASILASGVGSAGVQISAAATDTVTIRNISINGGAPALPAARGIRVTSAKTVNIENVSIFGSISTRGIEIANTSGTVNVNVVNTTVTGVSNHGIASLPVAPGQVELNVRDSRIYNNAGIGIDLFGTTRAIISNTNIVNNTSQGIFVEAVTSEAAIHNCQIAYNTTGVQGTGTARIAGNFITGNTTNGVLGTVISSGNNAIVGNTGNQTPSSSPGPQ